VLVKFESMGPDHYQLADDELSIVGARSGDSIALGDRMVVVIEDVAVLRRSVYGKRVVPEAVLEKLSEPAAKGEKAGLGDRARRFGSGRPERSRPERSQPGRRNPNSAARKGGSDAGARPSAGGGRPSGGGRPIGERLTVASGRPSAGGGRPGGGAGRPSGGGGGRPSGGKGGRRK